MIYPNEFPGARDEKNPEWLVFKAMKELSNEFDVFYTRSFSAKSPKERAEYEIDFIVADLRKNRFNALICVEVKGRELKVNLDETWTRNGKPIASPIKQVTSAMHSLVERYPELSSALPFGWMLCFPDIVCPVTDRLPESLRHNQIIDRIKLTDLENTLMEFLSNLKSFHKYMKGLEYPYYRKFKEVLLREYEFTMPLVKKISLDEEIFIKLTSEQAKILRMVQGNPNLHIKGTAGSGKTLIAVQAAREFDEKELRVLFLCYNKVLASNIRDFFNQIKRAYGTSGKIEVETYHSFANEIINKAEPGWWNQNIKKPNFWDLVVPEKIMDIKSKSGISRDYDVIIIDEGQDFNEYWFETVEYSLKTEGKFYVFMDEFQNINNSFASIPGKRSFFNVRLSENCRNTKKIASKLQEIINQEIESKDGMPDGVPVIIRKYREDKDQLALIIKDIEILLKDKKIKPDQILIMLNSEIKESSLSKTLTIGNLPLQELNENGELKNNVVNFTQINTFKGLEADIVLIIDMAKAGYDPRKLYTQASRAKHLLYFFEKAD